MNDPLPQFLHTQWAFTAHLRAPHAVAAPMDIAPARIAVYRELLRANIASSLNACFPVLRSALPPLRWEALIEDFFARHRCRTPIYRRIPDEFLAYLENTYRPAIDDPPFVTELAHYEWVELALSIDAEEINFDAIDANGNLWSGAPYVNPLAWLLVYRFPVHRIGPAAQPQTSAPTFIVVYRDRNDAVGFMELNALSARLLAILRTQSCTGAAAIAQVAAELNLESDTALAAPGRELLDTLRARDVILGTTK